MTRSDAVVGPTRTRSTPFLILAGLAALAVLLQGLWAGIFLEHDGARDDAAGWIEVHATGGEVAIALAAVATVVGFIQLRARRDLWIGALALTALLVLNAYLGGLIRDEGLDALTAVHIPLSMALMAFATWLPLRGAFRPAAAEPARTDR